MAFTGMKYIAVAKLATEPTHAAAPVYEAGKIIAKAIQANVNVNRNNAVLRADDSDAEFDDTISGISAEIGMDHLDNEDRVTFMDYVKKAGTGQNAATEYMDSDTPSPYVGVGYVRVGQKDNVPLYEGNLIVKAKLSEGNEQAQTKGETTTFQTPTVTARGMQVPNWINGSGSGFRLKAKFDTEADALAWVKSKLNITP